MKTKLRRVAILALVLVLFASNTIGALASTTDTAPKVTVSSYTGLYTALDKAKAGDVIGIKGTIVIPSPATYDYSGVTLKRMEAGAKIVFNDEYGYGGTTEITSLFFDGNARGIGGVEPFVEVAGDVTFNMCEFEDCFNEGGTGESVDIGTKGGAVYVSSGSVTFSSCKFIDNCADYGGAIFNNGILTLESCILEDNWAEETGGAIYNAGTLTVKNTELKGNTARMGGGLYNKGSTELYSSLVWNNTASIHGSDIANEGSLSDYTTDEEYNTLLNRYNLYFGGWENELDTSIGGAGEYKKLLTTDTAPTDPSEPTEPTDPEEPDDGDNTGGDTEDGGTTTPEDPDTGDNEEPTTPDGGDDATDPSTPPDEGGDNSSGEDPVEPDTPIDTEQGDNIDNSVTDNSVTDNSDHSSTDNSTTDNSITDNSQSSTDNSVTDNSTTDNSTVDNSSVDNSITDNSTHTEDNSGSGNTTDNSTHSSTTDNIQHSSTVDNSSVVSNTDNSSSRSESSNTENSNNTTTYNYYQTEQDKGSTGAPQSISQPITINVTVPQAKEPETGTQEPAGASQSIAQNIHIEAEGVNVKYEYTADGVSISISPYIAPESPTEADIIPTSLLPCRNATGASREPYKLGRLCEYDPLSDPSIIGAEGSLDEVES